MMTTGDKFYPPDNCGHGICKSKCAVAMIEVKTPRGEIKLVSFGDVCLKDNHGNVTNSLKAGYEFIQWHAWCGTHYLQRIDEEKKTQMKLGV
jgi:hypothetical protein